MEKVKIAQVAKFLGVSLNSVYRKVKLCETKLNGHVVKENGLTFVSSEGVEILRGLFSKLNLGETPENKSVSGDGHLQEIIANQQRTIDTLIAKHTEERARHAEERARADTIIMKLAHDLEDTRRSALAIESKVNALLPKPDQVDLEILSRPVPEVKAWQPQTPRDPLEGAGFLTRAWVYLLEPERLRRYMS